MTRDPRAMSKSKSSWPKPSRIWSSRQLQMRNNREYGHIHRDRRRQQDLEVSPTQPALSWSTAPLSVSGTGSHKMHGRRWDPNEGHR
ncbi:nwd2 [Moniliophthora roreri]|nr:nwd2 [Moniliophthora roreri]